MKHKIYRYFTKGPGIKIREAATWLFAPDNLANGVTIGASHPHPVTGDPTDRWIMLSCANSTYDGDINTYQTVPDTYVDMDENSPTFGTEVSYNKAVAVLTTNYDIYNMPIKPGYTQITQAEFNTPLPP